MVSTTNMVLMAVCVLVNVIAVVVPIVLIKRRSSKLETGLSGAIGYGFLGYIWYFIFYMFLGVGVMMLPIPGGAIVISILQTFVNTALTAGSLYWGIYLTNQKQLSLYRSAAVGIGFALGKIAIDLGYGYLYKLYLSFQINAGTFQKDEVLRTWVLNTTADEVVIGAYKCLLAYVIVFAIALIMGHYYLQKNKKMAWLSVIVIYESIMFADIILRYLSGTVFGWKWDILSILELTIFAAAGGIVLYNWFRLDEVEVNPLVIIRRMRGL